MEKKKSGQPKVTVHDTWLLHTRSNRRHAPVRQTRREVGIRPDLPPKGPPSRRALFLPNSLAGSLSLSDNNGLCLVAEHDTSEHCPGQGPRLRYSGFV